MTPSLLSVCPFKTPPCVRSKRPRVYRYHAHMLKHMCACCRHTGRRFECSHADVLHRHTYRHTQTHTENTHTQDTHGHTHRKRATRWTQTGPPSVRKDIPHSPQYQLNLRHLSFTAAVSTQNLDLPGFHPPPGFPGSAGVTRHKKIGAERSSKPWSRVNLGKKSELSAHQIPNASSPPHWISTLSVHQMRVPADLRTGFPTFSPLLGYRSFSACPSLLHSFPVTEGPARPLLSITKHAAGASACPNVSISTSLTCEHGCLLPRPLDTTSSASTLPDSPTGCVGLAANGAGPRRVYGRCDPCLREDPGEED